MKMEAGEAEGEGYRTEGEEVYGADGGEGEEDKEEEGEVVTTVTDKTSLGATVDFIYRS